MPESKQRQTPNPKSEMLSNALIGGTGLGIPPGGINPPPGMAAVVLFVPLKGILGKSIPEIQKDLGLPWYCEGGDPYWFN